MGRGVPCSTSPGEPYQSRGCSGAEKQGWDLVHSALCRAGATFLEVKDLGALARVLVSSFLISAAFWLSAELHSGVLVSAGTQARIRRVLYLLIVVSNPDVPGDRRDSQRGGMSKTLPGSSPE